VNPRRTIDDVLAEARRDLRRMSPAEAHEARVIGFEPAADVIGGVEAWQAAGLPLEQYRDLPRRAAVARA
jgi:hypothetical protein